MESQMKKSNLLVASLIIATSTYATALIAAVPSDKLSQGAITYSIDQSPLSLKVYNADSGSFNVSSTLVYGATEAVLIDTGFTKADALRIAANVLDSNKKLTTIFISQADPDFYFGTETLKKLFPNAKIITTPAVRHEIAEKMAHKVEFWGPKMGQNAPVTPILPSEYSATSFSVDGYTVEIKNSKGESANRPYLWIPETKTILGNVSVYSGVHVWMADSPSTQDINAWQTQLNQMQQLQPELVVPGHMVLGGDLTSNSIGYTARYIEQFVQTKAKSDNATAVIEKMNKNFPQAKFPLALDFSAKVHMGEMKW